MALLALAMLSFASVQSIVMQAFMTSSGTTAPTCGEKPADGSATSASMPGMGMEPAASPRGHGPHPPPGHGTACPYCVAAAHVPIIGDVVPPRRFVNFVFVAFPMPANRGARGPPAREARARGPPLPFLTG